MESVAGRVLGRAWMRLAGWLLLLFVTSAWVPADAQTADSRYLRFERGVADAEAGSVACALLPAEVFAHAAPSLADLRIYSGSTEVPYVTTLSQAAGPETQPARVLNVVVLGGRVAFDLEMPPRPYTEVTLDLVAKDFVAVAKVSGRDDSGSGKAKELGEFTLFDLTGEGLGRGTTLNLAESSFRFLHIDLVGAKGLTVRGAEVLPSREAQTLYTVVAAVAPRMQDGREIAVFHLPAHVPVERVSFELAAGFKGNFDRPVRVSARADGAGLDENLAGEILRVELVRDGRAVHMARLSVPATLGVNMQGGATVTVAVEGEVVPLAKVRLEMRERRLCFDAPAAGVRLFYGDPSLRAPVYEYARRFAPTVVRVARLGDEETNPAYVPRPVRRMRDRYPDLVWVMLLLVLGLVAVTTLRLTRHR